VKRNLIIFVIDTIVPCYYGWIRMGLPMRLSWWERKKKRKI